VVRHAGQDGGDTLVHERQGGGAVDEAGQRVDELLGKARLLGGEEGGMQYSEDMVKMTRVRATTTTTRVRKIRGKGTLQEGSEQRRA